MSASFLNTVGQIYLIFLKTNDFCTRQENSVGLPKSEFLTHSRNRFVLIGSGLRVDLDDCIKKHSLKTLLKLFRIVLKWSKKGQNQKNCQKWPTDYQKVGQNRLKMDHSWQKIKQNQEMFGELVSNIRKYSCINCVKQLYFV